MSYTGRHRPGPRHEQDEASSADLPDPSKATLRREIAPSSGWSKRRKSAAWLGLGAVTAVVLLPNILAEAEAFGADDMSPFEKSISVAAAGATGKQVGVACIDPVLDTALRYPDPFMWHWGYNDTSGVTVATKNGDPIPAALLTRDTCHGLEDFRDGGNTTPGYRAAVATLAIVLTSDGGDGKSEHAVRCTAISDFDKFGEELRGPQQPLDPSLLESIKVEEQCDHAG